MKTLDWSVETLGLDYNSTGLCNHLNQSSERNMIDIPGCSERTNFNHTMLGGYTSRDRGLQVFSYLT